MKTKKSLLFQSAIVAWGNSFKHHAHVAIGISPSSHFRNLAFTLLLLAASTGMVQAQNLIANGDFASGTTGWTGNNFSVVSGEAFISSTNSGGNLWDTQLVKGSLSFTVSTQYTLTFRARAAANRNITIAIQNVGTWGDQFRQQYTLTTTMQTFTSTFTSTSANANVQIGFLMAAQSSTAAIYYDDISLTVANPPILAATTAATSITTTSAVSGGNVTSQGGGSVTARGVVWSTLTAPTVALATKTVDGSGTGSFTSNITSLSSGVKYYVRSYATNSSGTAYGAEINFTTLDTEAPTAFTATTGAVTFNSVELLLNATDNSGSISYTISYGSGPTVVNTIGTSGVQKSLIITGLSASTDYTFSVVAKDASNNAAVNNPISVTATTTENTNTECLGTSTEKLQDTDFLTGYNYTFSTTGSGSTASVKVDFELLDVRTGIVAYAWTYNPSFAEAAMTLVSGKKYTKTFTNQTIGATFTVACKFAYAGGQSVTKKFLYTVGNACLTVPGKPTSIVATAGNGQASVAFTAPIVTGGSAITGYTVTSSPGGFTATGASSPLIVTGLSNTAYTFTVTATNAQGTSAASLASNSVTPITVPDAPTSVVATAGNAQASVGFNPPSVTGGSAITGYTVTSSPAGGIATGASSPLKVTGLTNGTAYTFTVTATNAQGTGAASTASSAVTPHATTNNIAVSSATNISAMTLTLVSDVVVSSNKLTINTAKTVNSITVAPGAQLELTSGNTLTAGTVTLQSDASGTATLVDNTTSSPQAITATVQQYVEAGRNWYMSIPLASGASSLLSRGTSVVCYDEPSGTWIAPEANTLNKLRGYIQVATSTPSVTGTTGTVAFTGVVNTGAHSINLTRTAGKTGFNLVGNPYPSYLDWNAVTKTNVSNTMWLRTKVGGVYKFFTYNTVDGAGGIGVPASVTRYIPPMQAFWVRVDAEGSGSIAVDNNMRSHNDVAGNIMKAPSQTPQKLLRLQVTNGTNTDETVLYFNANALDAFDRYDAQKRSNEDIAIPEIYTQVGTEKLVINGMKNILLDTPIGLGFVPGNATAFSIKANELSNIPVGVKVILKDNATMVETDLTDGVTTYQFSPATITTDRFSVIFRTAGASTGVKNTEKLNAQVFVNATNQITIIAPEKSFYSIYNAIGMLIDNGQTTAKLQTANCKLQTGIYVVQIVGEGRELTTRVIIK